MHVTITSHYSKNIFRFFNKTSIYKFIICSSLIWYLFLNSCIFFPSFYLASNFRYNYIHVSVIHDSWIKIIYNKLPIYIICFSALSACTVYAHIHTPVHRTSYSLSVLYWYQPHVIEHTIQNLAYTATSAQLYNCTSYVFYTYRWSCQFWWCATYYSLLTQ